MEKIDIEKNARGIHGWEHEQWMNSDRCYIHGVTYKKGVRIGDTYVG